MEAYSHPIILFVCCNKRKRFFHMLKSYQNEIQLRAHFALQGSDPSALNLFIVNKILSRY